MREVLHMGRGTVALIGFLSVGLLLINPVGLYYNLLWLGRSTSRRSSSTTTAALGRRRRPSRTAGRRTSSRTRGSRRVLTRG